MAVKLRPLADRVIVKPVKADEVSKYGIVLPDTAKTERPERGEVVAVGPGKVTNDGKLQPMSVQVGQVVVFTKYAPNEVKVDDEELLIIREDDIMAVIEK